MNNDEEKPYQSHRDVIDAHGLLVYAGYLLFKLSEATPTRLLNRLARTKLCQKWAVHPDNERVKPWVQDLAVIMLAIMTVVMVAVGARWPRLTSFLAWWLLADMLAHHSRVLWFDDLQMDRPWRLLRVFSHRRILFQGLVNFTQSVFLFGVLYRRWGCSTNLDGGLYRTSFSVAVTLSPSEGLTECGRSLVTAQMLLSLFFLVVMVSVVASVGYSRTEQAPRDPGTTRELKGEPEKMPKPPSHGGAVRGSGTIGRV